ncbi:MAG: PAS domain S-box protein [Opitutaceae bacterium]|nr:PAS domain S-box protein [Opitutaceae bacterium]
MRKPSRKSPPHPAAAEPKAPRPAPSRPAKAEAKAPRPAPTRLTVPANGRDPASPAGWIGSFDQLFPATNDIACFRDPGGAIIDASEAFQSMFGRRTDHWIGIPFEQIVHREDFSTLEQAQRQLSSSPHQANTEVRCRTLQGWRWMLWEESCCRDTTGRIIAIRAVGRDVTRRHMAEEQSFILAQAVEQSPIATAIADPDGFIRYSNPRFTECTGASLETLLERRERIFRDAHPTEEAYQAFLRQVRGGHPWRGEVSTRSPSGDPRWESVQVSAIRNPSGAVTNFLMLREEITERKTLEGQLRQAQKLESIGTLAGGIAHDFNNLLSIINGYSELLLSRPDNDDRATRFLGEIFKAGQRAVGLVRQILTFSRKVETLLAPVELNQLLRELAGMLQETFPRTIVFDFRLAPALPALLADQNQVQQILMNLCVNARDAMPAGGTLTLATEAVPGRELARLGGDPARSYQCIRVTDTGVGIPPAVLQRIFEPFFTTKEKGSGTGLGLAVVEGIVSRHSGLIDVRSTPDQGSTFLIYLPEAPMPATAPGERQVLPPARVLTGRVLIVEDEESLRNLTQGVLEARGFTVRTVDDGAKALDFLDRHASEIDCVILDVNMPRLNGISVFQVIHQKYTNLGVIVVSGYLSSEIKQQFLDLGQDVFIHKPFRVDDIIAKVNQVLSARHPA